MTDKGPKNENDQEDEKNAKKPTLATVLEQMETMRAELDGLKRKQTEPERVARDGVAVVSESDVEAFLNAPDQENVFWAVSPATPVIRLQADEKLWDEETKQHVPRPILWAEFTRWFGVGAELRREGGALLHPRGIGRYVLNTPKYESDGKRINAEYKVHLARLLDRADPKNLPRIYTDAEWKLLMHSEYGVRNAARDIQAKFRKQMDDLQGGVVEGDPKAGIR